MTYFNVGIFVREPISDLTRADSLPVYNGLNVAPSGVFANAWYWRYQPEKIIHIAIC